MSPRSRSSGDRLGRGRLDRVGDDEDAARPAVPADRDRRTSLALRALDDGGQLGRQVLRPVREQSRPADDDGVAVDDALHAEALDVGEVLDRLAAVRARRRRGAATARAIGCSEAYSSARGEAAYLVDGLAVGGHHVVDGHLAGGHGAGLVEHDRVDPAGRLEHLGALDQDAELGAAPGADHQRRRRRQAQRARAGDDQHGDRGGERGRRAAAGAEPEAEGGDGEPDHDRHEDAGDPVGQALHLGLAVLGVLDEPGHLGELGVGADPGRAHDEPAAGVDGRADDRVAGADLDRHRLAGEHRGVDRGGALDDLAVGRDLLAGADDELSPTTSWSTGTRTSTPSRSTATSLAPSSSSARSAAPAWRLARCSSQRPASRNVVTPAAASR